MDLYTAARTLLKITPAAATAIGALIAYLVYRLNGDRLYLDLMEKRHAALSEVLDAASERQREAATLRLDENIPSDLPAQRRFWIAMGKAVPLFDRPVHEAMDRLDKALGDFFSMRFQLMEARFAGERLTEAGKRHSDSVGEILQATKELTIQTNPFFELGARGLGFRAKLRRRWSTRRRFRRRSI